MRTIRLSLLLSFVLAVSCVTCAFAKTVNFELTVDANTVGVGNAIQLNLTFNNTQNMPPLEFPEIEGFRARYLGPSTRMSIVNSQVSSSITHAYTLLALKTGSYAIGPLKFDYNGDTYVSNPVSIAVTAQRNPPAQNQGPSGSPEASSPLGDINDRVFLVIQAEKNRGTINELIPISIKLYVNRLGIRDIEYPQIPHEGFSIGTFGQPRQYQETLAGVAYEVIEFNAVVFGTRTGEFRLGPATINCNLIVRKQSRRRPPSGFEDFFDSDIFEDFFGRYENYPLTLKSTDIPLTILDFPEENKPKDFSGAVGSFTFDADAGPREVKVGDPITLKITIKGEGNFNTVTIPRLRAEENFKVYEPQIKQEENQKSFEQILIPLRDELREVPEISFDFFNPKTGKYEIVRQGPFPIKVTQSAIQEPLRIIDPRGGGILQEEKLGRDIIFIKASPGDLRRRGAYLYANPFFLAIHLIALLVWIGAMIAHRIRTRLKNDTRYARLLHAPAKAKAGIRRAQDLLAQEKTKEFYDAVFGTLQEYLGDKFHLSSHGITTDIVDQLLVQKGIPAEILQQFRRLFRDCDMARYAPAEFGKENMEQALQALREVIDYVQRNIR